MHIQVIIHTIKQNRKREYIKCNIERIIKLNNKAKERTSLSWIEIYTKTVKTIKEKVIKTKCRRNSHPNLLLLSWNLGGGGPTYFGGNSLKTGHYTINSSTIITIMTSVTITTIIYI